MRSLDELLDHPRPLKTKGMDHLDSRQLLKIPGPMRTKNIMGSLLRQHEKLIYSSAAKYWKKYVGRVGGVLDFDDILAAARIGMMKAIERYNRTYNTEFSTYALHWIRQSIIREVENNAGVARLPVHFRHKIFRASQMSQLTKDQEDLIKISHDFDGSVSLDSPMEDGQTALSEVITYDRIPYLNGPRYYKTPEQLMLFVELQDRILHILENVKDSRNREMFKSRYGLNETAEGKTLEAVAENYGITRERVRQICDRILTKYFRVTKELDPTDLDIA